MNKKVVFKIDKNLDFKNHLIGTNIEGKYLEKISPEIKGYFESLKNADNKGKLEIFNNKTSKFYNDEMIDFRDLLVKQTEDMWNLVEERYFNKVEQIHKNKFPFEVIYGILSTTPMVYGYDFNSQNPWFACSFESPLKAIHTAMHEIMHVFFNQYFKEKYKEKFELNEEQLFMVKESLTVLLNLEFQDIRTSVDVSKNGHEKLRENIKENWLKYKDIEKVLDEACIFVKNNNIKDE